MSARIFSLLVAATLATSASSADSEQADFLREQLNPLLSAMALDPSQEADCQASYELCRAMCDKLSQDAFVTSGCNGLCDEALPAECEPAMIPE